MCLYSLTPYLFPQLYFPIIKIKSLKIAILIPQLSNGWRIWHADHLKNHFMRPTYEANHFMKNHFMRSYLQISTVLASGYNC